MLFIRIHTDSNVMARRLRADVARRLMGKPYEKEVIIEYIVSVPMRMGMPATYLEVEQLEFEGTTWDLTQELKDMGFLIKWSIPVAGRHFIIEPKAQEQGQPS